MGKIGLIWRTARHLQLRQLVYQLINRLRGRARLRLPRKCPEVYFLSVPDADKPVSYRAGTVTFLNQSVQFKDKIDWNYAEFGKLWTYNLTYFDYLNQGELDENGFDTSELTAELGISLIRQFINQSGSVVNGLESYPTSLRINNWVHFLSRHRIQDESVNAHLFAQVSLLNRRLEYHLGGNHLLENGFALLTGALFFRHKRWLLRSSERIRAEMTIQILADGAHDERSPVYHQIVLDRLLDVLLLLRANTGYTDAALVDFLTTKAVAMHRWLSSMTFSNGDVPMVNDAAWGVAPTTAQIQEKIKRTLPESWSKSFDQLPGVGQNESGYRLFRRSGYELFADVGAVGPDHQPGHAHADTLAFVLYVHGQPVLVDSGTSTYQMGPRRAWERSTAAHNTVEVDGLNSSEVWAGFRVGRRAQVTVLRDEDAVLSAQHDGYAPVGVMHRRTWHLEATQITIADRLMGSTSGWGKLREGVARLHFHADVAVSSIGNTVKAGAVTLHFRSDSPIHVATKPYEMADGFNRLRAAHCLEITFTNYLNTIVTLLA